MASAVLTRDQVLHYLPRHIKFYSLSFHVTDIKRLFQRAFLSVFYRICGLVNGINLSNMVAVSLLQVKKWRWGKLSQILQGKLSALKYCKYLDKNCEKHKKHKKTSK